MFANAETGRFVLDPNELADFLSLKEETVLSLFGRLRKEGYVSLRRDNSRLQVTILHWAPRTRLSKPPDVVAEVSSTRNLALKIAVAFEDESNLGRYEDLIEEHPRSVIERAFRDSLAMPEDRIRKSRGALFTYLLRKYAQQ